MSDVQVPEHERFGLYLHVPYCKALCHYCDFAKTANFSADHGSRYIARLGEDLTSWLGALDGLGVRRRFTSVFFGGGTPSLFGREYEALMERIRSVTVPGAEITLEGNPDDVTAERLQIWRDLGFNRISLGVQTFEDQGLAYLKRAHDSRAAKAAVTAATRVFGSVNLDLIYGWGDQTAGQWSSDIETALGLGISHLSLYTLTYEQRTPLGRAAHRGLITPRADDTLAEFYDVARGRLAEAGFDHVEVSNWSRAGHDCRHNAGYWRDQPYLGIGAGAHGFLKFAPGPGVRYAYPRDDRTFLRGGAVELEPGRTAETWLIDYVGTALRTRRGLDLALIRAETGKSLARQGLLAEGLGRGLLRVDAEGRLTLDPSEWFRESAWAVEVLRDLERSQEVGRLTTRNH